MYKKVGGRGGPVTDDSEVRQWDTTSITSDRRVLGDAGGGVNWWMRGGDI
jgi:hypothetical protein